ncbi:MAG: endonuclease MutS2 [Chlorobi bacterium]|nr:endonuclease MutS2 [Chlorobiota bacterium]
MKNYPENIEEKLGFDRVREILKHFTLSNLGQKQLEAVSFTQAPAEVFREQEETAEFMQILDEEKSFPLDHYADMIPVLERIRIEGAAFMTGELPPLKRSLETLKQVTRFFDEQEPGDFPRLRKVSGNIRLFPYLFEVLDKVLTAKGAIRDTATPALRDIRRRLFQQKKTVSGALEGLLRKAQHDGWVGKDASLTIRGGRMVIPVPATHKRRIPGLILDESASGKTVFIEPADIVERNNDIRALEFAERREIEKILTDLADAFRPYIKELTEAYTALGRFDLIQAKARWAEENDARVPETDDKPVVHWVQAVHPLLALNLKAEGREAVPLDISLDTEQRILMISGPNAGGKSVCLQTVGLLQYMFQCGIPVPVKETSRFGVFEALFLDFGDEQSIDNDLSTYSSRLLNMKYFLKHAGPQTLVLMDEFGSGTEPMLGAAIAEVVLQRLNRTGTFGVITTHYTNLKHVAASEKGITNGAMLFDQQKMQPLYRLDIGKPGSSFAFEMARKMGLPEDLLQEASGRVGEEHVLFDKHLRDILRDKRYWENKRRRIRQREKTLEVLLEKYEIELKTLSKERKKIIEEARAEASGMLSEVNRKIENTIRLIRETQADKEKTKTARSELESLKKKVAGGNGTGVEKLERKIHQAGSRREAIARKHGEPVPQKKTGKRELAPGDKVRLKGQEIPGEIMQVSDGHVLVAFGIMTTSVVPERLERVTEEEYRRYHRQSGHTSTWSDTLRQKRLQFRPEIDVRGKRANEALQEVMDFLDEAVMVEARNVRILHGKGDGILRQLIRDYLQTVDLVARYHDEHVDRGGAGITVVEMEG